MLLHKKQIFSNIVSNHRSKSRFFGKTKKQNKKTLSMFPLNFEEQLSDIPEKINNAKALNYVCPSCQGSFTVEAAMTVPIFLFAVLLALGIFWVLSIEIGVYGGMQYAARTLAASAENTTEEERSDSHSGSVDEEDSFLTLAKGRVLFQKYIREQSKQTDILNRGLGNVSFVQSDFSGEYITLRASYQIKLPIAAFGFGKLPVRQCVRTRKWIGNTYGDGEAEEGWCFITPSGRAYHASSGCPYLDLSVRSVSLSEIEALRNKSGGIYYPCSCFKRGQTAVYITDYGSEYHSSLSCRGLKRTVTKVRKSQVGGRHPCSKCYGS